MSASISSSALLLLLVIAVLLLFPTPVFCAEWSKLKKCADLGFCRRHRHFFLDEAFGYSLAEESLKFDSWRGLPALVGRLECDAVDHPPLRLAIADIGSGVFRVIVDEIAPLYDRPIVRDALANGVEPKHLQEENAFLLKDVGHTTLIVKGSPTLIRVWWKPFRVEYLRDKDEKVLASINGQSRLFIERQIKKPTPSPTPEDAGSESPEVSSEDAAGAGSPSVVPDVSPADTGAKHADYDMDDEYHYDEDGDPGAEDNTPSPSPETPEDDCDGCWEERFQSHTDPKLRGPESAGADISFPFADHIYGIPERTTRFSLEDTVDAEGNVVSEPYRLYNLDVFEFELDKPLGLYGSIPFLTARNGKDACGMVWMNSAETYVDVRGTKEPVGKATHWYSETGAIDIYLIPGPTPGDVFKQYLRLTGKPAIPQRFALGYHQCRWNYRDEEDSKAVDAGFDERDIPYDVLWLDIEHTDGKRYFTWDYSRFPDPTALQNHIASRGRKMVTIVDPHVKRDNKYSLHRFATERNYYVMKPDGKPFDGWCWPGSSSYFDFASPEIRAAFAGRFNPTDYPHFTEHLYTWNDMNEPSVFNGPEGTMQKDLIHVGNVEHRHVHNIYGHYFMQATFEGLLKGHGGNDRPFVLSRSFFAGSQRYGAIWTGDNTANWEHLESTVRMLLPLQITGMVFSGADVGGFFGNPSAELLSRWYQAGAFQPFFRGHAHLDTNRREPWLFGEPYTSIIAKAIRTRYEYLPLWYTLFAGNALGAEYGFEDSGRGPPMRPVWWEFPEDKGSDTDETQWMVGNALLVSPVLKEGASKHTVRLPGGVWYDLFAPGEFGKRVSGSGAVELATPLERMVVLQRGGAIVAKLERRRRSTRAMGRDPLTLVVGLDAGGAARGELYLDDGRSYDHGRGHYAVRRFAFADGALTASTAGGGEKAFEGSEAAVERVVVLGWGGGLRRVTADGREVGFERDGDVVTVRRPGVKAGHGEWVVRLES